MERISPTSAAEQEYEIPTSALLKYYFHRVATRIGIPKTSDERDLRTRKVRRQERK